MTKAADSMSGSDAQQSPLPSNKAQGSQGFNTLAIHAGQTPCSVTGSVIPPIYMTSTYVQEWPAQHKGYDYTRAGNPSFTSLEQQIAALEGGKYAVAFSSGLGALMSYISSLDFSNDRVMAINSLYGGSYRMLTKIFSPKGLKIDRVNVRELESLHHFKDMLVQFKSTVFIFETPTNPLLEVLDITGICAVCKELGVTTIIDNTFASPYNQRPLEFGGTMVLHSSTKYIGGHSDVIGGAMITNSKDVYDKLIFNRMAIGTNPSPFDCFLLTRSLKTLGVRMDRHNYNAMKFAQYLSDHPMVRKVYYPGLSSHSNHEIAKKQLTAEGGFSGIVSAEFELSLEETKQLVSHMKLFALAESLGGVESLVCHPASMTHASIPPDVRLEAGLADGLIRFSVGLENIDDLLLDISDALGLLKVSHAAAERH